jgi:hypothetical protein
VRTTLTLLPKSGKMLSTATTVTMAMAVIIVRTTTKVAAPMNARALEEMFDCVGRELFSGNREVYMSLNRRDFDFDLLRISMLYIWFTNSAVE